MTVSATPTDGGRANYVCMDGHTATLTPAAAAVAIFDPRQAP